MCKIEDRHEKIMDQLLDCIEKASTDTEKNLAIQNYNQFLGACHTAMMILRFKSKDKKA